MGNQGTAVRGGRRVDDRVMTVTCRPSSTTVAEIAFDKPHLLSDVFGEYDRNLIRIENRLGISISARGNRIRIEGSIDLVAAAETLLRDLYRKAECGGLIEDADIDVLMRAQHEPQLRAVITPQDGATPIVSIKTRLKTITPRNPAQTQYMQALQRDEMIFALGPAGTGKTYIAVAQAVAELMAGNVKKLILSRPAVEAGEKLGFLPGDLKEKVDPYLRPIYDALNDCMPADQVERRIANGEIEVAPLAFMRGRTLSDAFIILDEAQNTTPGQMKMFLTRFGENSRMVICGDPKQTDLPGGPSASGLGDAIHRLEGVDGINFSHFGSGDVVRHAIVGRIVSAYED